MDKLISVDMDGVIRDKMTDNPVRGALSALRSLEGMGFNIYIFTARKNLEEARNWLKNNGFRDYHVTNRKNPSIAYIDDHAINFHNNWDEIVQKFLAATGHFDPTKNIYPEEN